MKRLIWPTRSSRLAGLRSERGYSATKHDRSTGEIPKIVRRQFGRFYDGKKVRNSKTLLTHKPEMLSFAVSNRTLDAWICLNMGNCERIGLLFGIKDSIKFPLAKIAAALGCEQDAGGFFRKYHCTFAMFKYWYFGLHVCRLQCL